MKYLALIFGDENAWQALSEEDRKQVYERYRAFSAEADGKIVAGAQTAPNAPRRQYGCATARRS
jgi:hypothetical protein